MMKNEFEAQEGGRMCAAFFCCVRRYWLLMNSNISFNIFFCQRHERSQEVEKHKYFEFSLENFLSLLPFWSKGKRLETWKYYLTSFPTLFFVQFSTHSLRSSVNKWNNITQLMSLWKGNEEKPSNSIYFNGCLCPEKRIVCYRKQIQF